MDPSLASEPISFEALDGGSFEVDGAFYPQILEAQAVSKVHAPLILSGTQGDTCASAPLVNWTGSPAVISPTGHVAIDNFPNNCQPVSNAVAVSADVPANTRDIVFQFVPPQTGTYRINAVGRNVSTGSTSYPTRVLVSRGNCGAGGTGEGLACSDSKLTWLPNTAVQIDAIAGTPHFVRVDVTNNFGPLTGVSLDVNITAVTLGTGAVTVSTSGNTCSPMPTITGTGSPALEGLVGVYSTSAPSDCVPHDALDAANGRDVTFKFVAPTTGTFNIGVSSSTMYPSMVPAYPMTPTPGAPTAPMPAFGIQLLSSCGTPGYAACVATPTTSPTSGTLSVNATTAGQTFFVRLETTASSGRYYVSITKQGSMPY